MKNYGLTPRQYKMGKGITKMVKSFVDVDNSKVKAYAKKYKK